MNERASETHLAAAGATLQPCDNCATPFKPRRGWGRFCKDKCRNDFNAREARKEAIRARALVMYECLADFASQGNRAAAEAIKDLKAP